MNVEALPPPLVPAEVDLRDFQYMELDVRTLRDSRFAAQVTGDAFRAGVLLWCAAWHQVPAGSLPDDDVELANLAGYGRFIKEWRKVRDEALTQFVKCSDGRLYHETVCEKASAAWNGKLRHHYEKARDRLRKANKARAADQIPPIPELTFEAWNVQRLAAGIPMEKADASAGIPQKTPEESSGDPSEFQRKTLLEGKGEGEVEGKGEGEGDLLGIGGGGPTEPPAHAPAAGAAPTPAPAADRGSRLPKDWVLPKAWGEWALTEYPLWTADKVRREGAAFRDHWTAKTGKDATKLDWQATWRNWCRSDIAHRDDPKPGGGARGAAQQAATTDGVRAHLGLPPAPGGDIFDLEPTHG